MDWNRFEDSWDDLPLGRHMADKGRYRRRRHAVYVIRDDGKDRAASRRSRTSRPSTTTR
jgi:hypothetical protein